MKKTDYTELVQILKTNNPTLYNDRCALEAKLVEFEAQIAKLGDSYDEKIARKILIQGRNLIATILEKELMEEEK